jgi:PAS domain S-box-containing protein
LFTIEITNWSIAVFLKENDEDIGALGSILSWDEDDDVAASPAPSTMVEQRQTLTGAPMLFPQQVTVTGTTQIPGLHQQIQQQVSSFSGYAMVAQMSQLQQQQMQAQQHQQLIQQHQQQQAQHQQAQQQQHQVQHQQAQQQQIQQTQQQPSQHQQVQQQQAQQQSAVSSAPVGSAPVVHQQQMLPPGVQMMQQQQHYAAMYQQMQSVPVMQSSSQSATMQPFLATSDPNAFLRQMQTVQSLQFSVQPQQQQSLAPACQQQPVLMPPHQTVITSSAKASRLKRKASEPRSNIVSSSDTDGESKGPGSVSESTSTSSKPKKVTLHLAPVPPTCSSEDYGESADNTDGAEFDIDTSNMTTVEKAKANRDRNREHARNTRLRKKAYLEKLKTTVDELCRERDTLVSERAGAANLLVEMHNTRTEVLMSFFALRSTYEKQRELWSSILDESCFACVMPVTPYRSFPASEVQVSKCQRTIMGIDGVMADTASLHVLLNSLIDRSRYPMAGIQFRYTLVTEDAVVAGNQMMARWVMSTLNATQCGARTEVAKQGMLCAKFNSAHKIIGLELMFDVMAFMLQLKQASGSELFSVVPNTVQTCQRSFDLPMVMTLAERPYTVVQVNKLWEQMTGYTAEDVVGKASCRVLQGQDTDHQVVDSLMNEIRYKRPASAMILNYSREGKAFRNFLSFFPLSTDSKITHYVALTSHIDDKNINSTSNKVAPAAQELQQVQVAQLVLPKTPASAHPPVFLPGMNQQTAAPQGAAQPMLTFYQPQPIYSMPVMLPPTMSTASLSAAASQL